MIQVIAEGHILVSVNNVPARERAAGPSRERVLEIILVIENNIGKIIEHEAAKPARGVRMAHVDEGVSDASVEDRGEQDTELPKESKSITAPAVRYLGDVRILKPLAKRRAFVQDRGHTPHVEHVNVVVFISSVLLNTYLYELDRSVAETELTLEVEGDNTRRRGMHKREVDERECAEGRAGGIVVARAVGSRAAVRRGGQAIGRAVKHSGRAIGRAGRHSRVASSNSGDGEEGAAELLSASLALVSGMSVVEEHGVVGLSETEVSCKRTRDWYPHRLKVVTK